MPSTSGTFNFQSLQIELLIREAFENIGIFGEQVESQKLDSAKRSIDLLMLEWMNKSVNLWTLEVEYIPLVTSQAQYLLSASINGISDVVQINLRTSDRELNGTAAALAGNANNAFDGNPATYCNAGINGWISYNYGDNVTQQINFVGLQSEISTTLTPVVETSNDGINWTLLVTLPIQVYNEGVINWFDILTPIQSQYYRIRETDGGRLSMQEIYFNNNIFDMPISEVSRYEYYTYPNKQLQGRPSVYYVDRQIDPYLYIWPVPDPNYNCLQCSYKRMIQDAGSYTNSLEIPSRFYPALTLGLSWKLAIKFNPQVAPMFKADYEQAFNIATIEDSENVPITISGDTTYNYGR